MVVHLDGLANSLADVVRGQIVETTAEAADVYFPPPPLRAEETAGTLVGDVRPHPSLLSALRKFTGDSHANFTFPMQAVLLQLIHEGKQNLLAILPTSAGKTMTILLAAKTFARAQTTVVVLPLLRMHEEMHSRARQAGLTASMFASSSTIGSFDEHANIVTVAVESLDKPALNAYVFQN